MRFQYTVRLHHHLCIVLFALLAFSACATDAAVQHRLLQALDTGRVPWIGAWQVDNVTVRLANGVEPRLGEAATLISGQAKIAGAKVDATLFDGELPSCQQLSLWVYATPASNAATVGFQVRDAKGEWLMQVVPVNWTGWRCITIDPTAGGMRQAYAQKDQNGTLDFPISTVHLVWFTAAAGQTALSVNLLSAQVDGLPDDGTAFRMLGNTVIEPNLPFTVRLVAENHATQDRAVHVHYTLQRNSDFREPANADTDIPKVGELVASGESDVVVPAQDFRELMLNSAVKPGPGAYLLGLEISGTQKTQLLWSHLLVLPADTVPSDQADRFGINGNGAQAAYTESMRRCGFGWVRFENGKWAMFMPAKDKVGFDGSTPPWHVNMDAIYTAYQNQGLHVLPYVFLTPEWATTAPSTVQRNRMGYPPLDTAGYREAIFQKVARYGKVKVAADKLLSEDKKTGLNLIDAIELWNEPNLNDPGWGPFVGSMAQYFELMRAGVEGARAADPSLTVTAGGLAGLDLETVGQLGEYTYADGKTPLDLVDVINVHFYSGRAEPETAGWDPNADRNGPRTGGSTYPEQLSDLVAWRDQHKPTAQIWMTETGNDVGGPMGLTERHQAGKVPRSVMLALAAGVDKVFIYRESGSTPSQHAGAGLLRNDGSVRPMWLTVATMIRQLQGVHGPALRLPSDDPQVWLYLWEQGERRVITVWTLGEPRQLGLSLGEATVCDGFGHSSTVADTATVMLGSIPTYITVNKPNAAFTTLRTTAQTQAQARVVEYQRLSKIPALLFDFGSTDRVGMLNGCGMPRRFQAVTKDTVWSDQSKFGFLQKPVEDVSMRWINDSLECDGCRMGPGGTFRFRLDDARPYTLRVRAGALNTKQPVDITVTIGGDKQMKTLTADTPVAEFTVTGGNTPIDISLSTWSLLRWISAIPADLK